MALRGWPQGCWLYGRSASAVIAHPMTTGGNGSSPREDRGKAALQQSLSPQCLCVPGPSHLWAVTCEGPECTDDVEVGTGWLACLVLKSLFTGEAEDALA